MVFSCCHQAFAEAKGKSARQLLEKRKEVDERLRKSGDLPPKK